MTVKEFFDKAKKHGLSGPARVHTRLNLRPGQSVELDQVELSFQNTNNDLITAGDFGAHMVGPVTIQRAFSSKANAFSGRGGHFIIEDA